MPFNTETASEAGRKSGATRKAQKPPLTEGLAAAAGIIGVAVEVIQKAKKAGCPGFRAGNRIDTAKVEEWLLLNGDAIGEGQSLNALRRRNIMAKIGAERIEYDTLDASYIGTDVVAEACHRAARANKEIAERLLSASLRVPYVESVSAAFDRLARKMNRKTRHTAPPALIPPEPKGGDSLDDLRGILLAWKTRNLEAKNSLENGELIELAKVHDMIGIAVAQPVSVARKHTSSAQEWNVFCQALHAEFTRVLTEPFNPTPLPA